MLLTLPIKLETTPEQAVVLLATMERVNEASTWIAGKAREADEWRTVPLHYVAYYPARERFPDLAANMVNDCIRVVAAARSTKPNKFSKRAAIPYRHATLSWRDSGVSLWTLEGRLRLPVVVGKCQRERLTRRRHQAYLMYRDATFYLNVVFEADTTDAQPAAEYLGLDLGIVNLATDSDGAVHTGADVERHRRIHSHRRRNLQRKNTRAARRKLRGLKQKQARYQRDVNHRISKQVVRHAEGTGRGIALEDLKGIRERVTVMRRKQRARHSNWGFSQLRLFIEYKAKLAGVPAVVVDPRNTSRTCPECGLIDKANRPTRDRFRCKDCGHAGPADVIAATNIARAAAVQPKVAA